MDYINELNKLNKTSDEPVKIEIQIQNKINKIMSIFCYFGYELSEYYIISILNKNIMIDDELTKKYVPTKTFYNKCNFPSLIKSANKKNFSFN